MVSQIITTCVLLIFGLQLSSSAKTHCHDAFVEIWNDCYYVYGVNIMEPDSYVVWPSNFLSVCNFRENITGLIKCYEDVIAKCPETYRENGPAMMDPKGFRAFLIGLCTNKQVFEDGKSCVARQYKYRSFNDHVASVCLPESFIDTQWDAYIYEDWKPYCRRFDEGMECVKNKTNEYGCYSFTQFVWYSAYARQPPMCRDNSSKYAWIDMYQSIPSGSVSWIINPTCLVFSGISLILMYELLQNRP